VLSDDRWTEVSPSEYAWEREALEFVRRHLPDREPILAWSNLEFIADDGSINEIDLLVHTLKGVFVVEIKSYPGVLRTEAGEWFTEHEGKRIRRENPIFLTNRKAKKLRSRLENTQAVRSAPGVRGQRLPFFQAVTFLSNEQLRSALPPTASQHTYQRDRLDDAGNPLLETGPAAPGATRLPGIIGALTNPAGDEFDSNRRRGDRRSATLLAQALAEIGVRPGTRTRRVGQYAVGELLGEGPGYQDFLGTHIEIAGDRRRIRRYQTAAAATEDERATIARAARREYELVRRLDHSGIVRALDYVNDEGGPCILFEHEHDATPLGTAIAEQGDRIGFDDRLVLIRAVAEAIAYAHDRGVVHRALSPRSILVNPARLSRGVRILDWQTGARGDDEGATSTHTAVSGTVHGPALMDDQTGAYVAPEYAWNRELDLQDAVLADVFSLGAVAFHIMSGRPPASSAADLLSALGRDGLELPASADGMPDSLTKLIRAATSPRMFERVESVAAFLRHLDAVEDDYTRPEPPARIDPTAARAGDVLEGRFTVRRRLGRGATSVVYELDGTDSPQVLKVSLDVDHNDVLRAEAQVLHRLPTHPSIVRFDEVVEVYDRIGLVMARAGQETLSAVLRKDGALQPEYLSRYGEDLLQAVQHLEEHGVPHRDIKPSNLGIEPRGKNRVPHLVLFDFSLSSAPTDNVRVGTPPYLEPFLDLRPARRWDAAAERFATAVTLYEMATGSTPTWGDGHSNPAVLECEVTLRADDFDPQVAEPLMRFFARALARNVSERFDSAESMLRDWRRALDLSHHVTPPDAPDRLDAAQLDDAVSSLGLDVNVDAALARAQIFTVRELLQAPSQTFVRRGIGNRTRRRIHELIRDLRTFFPEIRPDRAPPRVSREHTAVTAPRSLDLLVPDLVPAETKRNADRVRFTRLLLGLDEVAELPAWPSQGDLARFLGVHRQRTEQHLEAARARWRTHPSAASLPADLAATLDALGGIATADEVAAHMLVLRGSVADEPERTRQAQAAARAAIEMELRNGSRGLVTRRTAGVLLVARDQPGGAGAADLVRYAEGLGHVADALAARDALPPPVAVLNALAEVLAPDELVPLGETRLVRLAAAVSRTAAASARLEIYPRGMPADRALRLSQAALLGGSLSADELSRRVRARFPDAAALPPRPDLDAVLTEVGIDLQWNVARQLYEPRDVTGLASSRTSIGSVSQTDAKGVPAAERAADLHQQLVNAHANGGFLALSVSRREVERATAALRRTFALQLVDLDDRLIRAMQQWSEQKGAVWTVVLAADAAPRDSQDWQRLLWVAREGAQRVREELTQLDGVALAVRPGLFARYGLMSVLEALRDDLDRGRAGNLRGLWLLAPRLVGSGLPVVDGVPVPVVGAAQWARLSGAWIARHLPAEVAA